MYAFNLFLTNLTVGRLIFTVLILNALHVIG